MSGYGAAITWNRDRASQIVRSGWATARTGALSIAYIVHHIILLLLLPSAVFLFAFGTGGTLIDPAKAYETWDWWRIYSFFFVLFAPSFGEFWLYQERKVAFSSNTAAAASFYNRSQVNVVWGIWMVMVIALGAWSAFITIYVGAADLGDCANSPLCGGPSGSSTPSTGAILIIVGSGLATLLFIALFLGGLYVHSAARDAYAARIGGFAPMGQQIGAEMDAAAVNSCPTCTPRVDAELTEWARATLAEDPHPLISGIGSALEWVASVLPDNAGSPVYLTAQEEEGDQTLTRATARVRL